MHLIRSNIITGISGEQTLVSMIYLSFVCSPASAHSFSPDELEKIRCSSDRAIGHFLFFRFAFDLDKHTNFSFISSWMFYGQEKKRNAWQLSGMSSSTGRSNEFLGAKDERRNKSWRSGRMSLVFSLRFRHSGPVCQALVDQQLHRERYERINLSLVSIDPEKKCDENGRSIDWRRRRTQESFSHRMTKIFVRVLPIRINGRERETSRNESTTVHRGDGRDNAQRICERLRDHLNQKEKKRNDLFDRRSSTDRSDVLIHR